MEARRIKGSRRFEIRRVKGIHRLMMGHGIPIGVYSTFLHFFCSFPFLYSCNEEKNRTFNIRIPEIWRA
jgi:hypothetical protein